MLVSSNSFCHCYYVRQGGCFHCVCFFSLYARSRTQTTFTKWATEKNTIDFSGNPDHVTLRFGVAYRAAWVGHFGLRFSGGRCAIRHNTVYFTQRLFNSNIFAVPAPFSTLTLLVGRQERHPACKKLGFGLVVVSIILELCTSRSSSCHHHLHHPYLQ